MKIRKILTENTTGPSFHLKKNLKENRWRGIFKIYFKKWKKT